MAIDNRSDLEILIEHSDCDWNSRVPSGLEELDPAGIERVVADSVGSDRPVVLKFGKHFCGWTKKLNRALVEWAPQYAHAADFYEVNIPSHEEVRELWQLTTSPMLILIKNGQEVDRSDAAEAHELPPVLAEWFGEPRQG
ncbi:MAG TPA: thioredoxin family protein [Limnochordia bacterium]|nr:thioredoxin family protein [Limnochordia bacterium]